MTDSRSIVPEGWKVVDPQEGTAATRIYPLQRGISVVTVKSPAPSKLHDACLEMDTFMGVYHTEDPSLVVELLRQSLNQNIVMGQNLTEIQNRSSELINKARDWRKKIIELGGEDPGSP